MQLSKFFKTPEEITLAALDLVHGEERESALGISSKHYEGGELADAWLAARLHHMDLLKDRYHSDVLDEGRKRLRELHAVMVKNDAPEVPTLYDMRHCALVFGKEPERLINGYLGNIFLVDNGPVSEICAEVGVEFQPAMISTAVREHLNLQDYPTLALVESGVDNATVGSFIHDLMLRTSRPPDGILIVKEKRLHLLVPADITKGPKLFDKVEVGGTFEQFLLQYSGGPGHFSLPVEKIYWEKMFQRSLTMAGGTTELDSVTETLEKTPSLRHHLPQQLVDPRAYLAYHEWLYTLPWFIITENGYLSFEKEFGDEPEWNPVEPYYDHLESWAGMLFAVVEETLEGTPVTAFDVCPF